jgi:hypothetical protein
MGPTNVDDSDEGGDKIYDQGLDMLSMYGQDDLLQSVFVAGETLVELESENHSLC